MLVLLHAGAAKTSSSTDQAHLWRYRERLAQAGFLCPHFPGPREWIDHWQLVTFWQDHLHPVAAYRAWIARAAGRPVPEWAMLPRRTSRSVRPAAHCCCACVTPPTRCTMSPPTPQPAGCHRKPVAPCRPPLRWARPPEWPARLAAHNHSVWNATVDRSEHDESQRAALRIPTDLRLPAIGPEDLRQGVESAWSPDFNAAFGQQVQARPPPWARPVHNCLSRVNWGPTGAQAFVTLRRHRVNPASRSVHGRRQRKDHRDRQQGSRWRIEARMLDLDGDFQGTGFDASAAPVHLPDRTLAGLLRLPLGGASLHEGVHRHCGAPSGGRQHQPSVDRISACAHPVQSRLARLAGAAACSPLSAY